MEVYLLSKLVTAKPMLYSEWLQEQGEVMSEELIDRQGMYVVETDDGDHAIEMWVPLRIFKQHYSRYMAQ